MERHDDHTIPENAGEIKVPFLHSIRLRLLLVIVLPMLCCILTIAILSNVFGRAAGDMYGVVDLQTELYHALSLPDALCARLSGYLSGGGAAALAEYRAVEEEFDAFTERLGESFGDGPYSDTFLRMGANLTGSAQRAISLLGDDERMLEAFREAEDIRSAMMRFAPYVSKEVEEASGEHAAAVMARVRGALRGGVALLLAVLAALVAASLILVRSFMRPLTTLTSAARSMTIAADGPTLSTTDRQDEFGILLHAYRDMEKRLQAQLRQLEDKRRVEQMLQLEREKALETAGQLARSELRVYQSQINGHFLFNAFNTVSRLAYIEDAPQVQNAVNLIAQFLRNTITQFDRSVTVEEEFSIVSTYTQIQDLRFGGRIKVEGVMDAGTEWFVLPALTLQPLVENAYGHGLSDSREGYIRYGAELEGELLRLYVWDDGRGIPPERQRQLRAYITGADGGDTELSRESIGLRNVYQRLLLMYPDRVELTLESEEKVYTKIGFAIRTGAAETEAS